MGTVFDGFIGYTKGWGCRVVFLRWASLAAVSGIACMCICIYEDEVAGGVWKRLLSNHLVKAALRSNSAQRCGACQRR